MKNNSSGMTVIVKTITRITIGLIIIYGIYIVLAGHISPGGGFVGGVIIALSLIHSVLAFGSDAAVIKFTPQKCLFLVSLAGLVFLVISWLNFMGFIRPGSLAQHYQIFSGGFTPFVDIAVALMTGIGLFLIFTALVVSTDNKEVK